MNSIPGVLCHPLRFMYSPFVWTVAVLLLNANSVHSQFNPMYPTAGGRTNPRLYGTRQLSLYPMSMMNPQFGLPGMNSFAYPGAMGGSQFGSFSQRPMQQMFGAYPSMMSGQFGGFPSQSMMPGGSYPFGGGSSMGGNSGSRSGSSGSNQYGSSMGSGGDSYEGSNMQQQQRSSSSG